MAEPATEQSSGIERVESLDDLPRLIPPRGVATTGVEIGPEKESLPRRVDDPRDERKLHRQINKRDIAGEHERGRCPENIAATKALQSRDQDDRAENNRQHRQ